MDGANHSFIRELKDRVDEDTNYEQQTLFYKKNYPSLYDLQFLQQTMFVILYRLARSTRTQEHTYCNQMLEHIDGTLSHIL